MIARSPRLAVAIAAVCVVALSVAAVSVPWPRLLASKRYSDALKEATGVGARGMISGETPNVAWDTADPEQEGLSGVALDSLLETLERRTMALLVVRNGNLVYEWYGPGHSPNSRFSTAALAKAVVGTMVLLEMAADGLVGLDEPASRYIPVWRNDQERARITLRQLASHSSGLDNVRFPPSREEDAWFRTVPAWHRFYFKNADQRFRLAVTTAPLLFPPGSNHLYSGVGYYALAYALSAALTSQSGEMLRFIAQRVYGPLGIPPDAWQISYGHAWAQDGLTLYALGSGGSLTARAAARIGQAVLEQSNGALAPLWDSVATRATRRSESDPLAHVTPHFGWWGNEERAWPSLPPDALVGLGAGNKVVLVVPSRQTVVVHLGNARSGPFFPADAEGPLENELFTPLSRTLRLGTEQQ